MLFLTSNEFTPSFWYHRDISFAEKLEIIDWLSSVETGPDSDFIEDLEMIDYIDQFDPTFASSIE